MNHYQKVYRFANNWGVSVICKERVSYGGIEGLFEAAILKFKDDEDQAGELYYSPERRCGWLSFQDVADILKEIEGRRKHNGI